MNEQKKHEAIKKLVETNGNKNRAAACLGCSRRTIDRLVKAYKEHGKAAFSHGNKGRKPANAVPGDVRRQVSLLYENQYSNANIRHFTELLAAREGIRLSEGTVRNILLSDGILSPRAHKSTRKALKERLQTEQRQAPSKKEKARVAQKLLTVDDPHPRRPRCQYSGEMIQMDASPHLWFGAGKTTLHAAIDDATGTLVGAYFDAQETLNGYYHVFKQILTGYGIPYMFYTDRRTVFEYKKGRSPSTENDAFTQFGYACKQLGVDLKTTSVPQAKGRVERLFGTLQSRLPIEMRLAGITTLERANEFLNSYIKKFNARFALDMNCTKSVFEKQPDEEKIDQCLSIIASRKVDSGHCVRYQNKYYAMIDGQGVRDDFRKGTEVMVAKTLSGRLYANVHGRTYCLDEVPAHERVSRYFNTKKEQEKAKEKKPRHVPDMDHPWKKDNFMKYVHAMAGNEEKWAW